MNNVLKKAVAVAVAAGSLALATSANATWWHHKHHKAKTGCSTVSRADLQDALDTVVAQNKGATGGFNLPMWLTFVDEAGKVCEVVTSGDTGSLASRTQWLGSRVISAQKANTANAFSINGVSISSGALMAAVQPGGSLYGLSDSNPVDAARAYWGNSASYGTHWDALKNARVGGINTFGGGLAVYKDGVKVGAIGVSGDTSCTDHATAWRVRDEIGGNPNFDNFPAGGGFERLSIRTVLANLGDHTTCYNDDEIKNDEDAGYNPQ